MRARDAQQMVDWYIHIVGDCKIDTTKNNLRVEKHVRVVVFGVGQRGVRSDVVASFVLVVRVACAGGHKWGRLVVVLGGIPFLEYSRKSRTL